LAFLLYITYLTKSIYKLFEVKKFKVFVVQLFKEAQHLRKVLITLTLGSIFIRKSFCVIIIYNQIDHSNLILGVVSFSAKIYILTLKDFFWVQTNVVLYELLLNLKITMWPIPIVLVYTICTHFMNIFYLYKRDRSSCFWDIVATSWRNVVTFNMFF